MLRNTRLSKTEVIDYLTLDELQQELDIVAEVRKIEREGDWKNPFGQTMLEHAFSFIMSVFRNGDSQHLQCESESDTVKAWLSYMQLQLIFLTLMGVCALEQALASATDLELTETGVVYFNMAKFCYTVMAPASFTVVGGILVLAQGLLTMPEAKIRVHMNEHKDQFHFTVKLAILTWFTFMCAFGFSAMARAHQKHDTNGTEANITIIALACSAVPIVHMLVTFPKALYGSARPWGEAFDTVQQKLLNRQESIALRDQASTRVSHAEMHTFNEKNFVFLKALSLERYADDLDRAMVEIEDVRSLVKENNKDLANTLLEASGVAKPGHRLKIILALDGGSDGLEEKDVVLEEESGKALGRALTFEEEFGGGSSEEGEEEGPIEMVANPLSHPPGREL